MYIFFLFLNVVQRTAIGGSRSVATQRLSQYLELVQAADEVRGTRAVCW